MNNLNFIILDYLDAKTWNFRLTQRFLRLVHKQSLYLEVIMPSRHVAKYNKRRDNALRTQYCSID